MRVAFTVAYRLLPGLKRKSGLTIDVDHSTLVQHAIRIPPELSRSKGSVAGRQAPR